MTVNTNWWKDEIFYQKLSEDLWDLDDKINRIENK